MTNEQWEFLANNWGSQEDGVMEELGRIKDLDTGELQRLQDVSTKDKERIAELERKLGDATRQNVGLVLRLVDDGAINPGDIDKEEEEYVAPKIDDYEKFVKYS